MVLPVSGFLPVPLPMMIPFMGAQSLVIGKMFGEGFQYGKRKISAMSNEEFNKLTFEDMMSNARTELKASIPTINASLQDMDEMVVVVVNEFLKYLGLVTKTVLETTVSKSADILDAGAHLVGTHLGHETTAGTTIQSETFVTSPTATAVPPPINAPASPSVDISKTLAVDIWPITIGASNMIRISPTKNEVELLLVQYEKARDNFLEKSHWTMYHRMNSSIRILEHQLTLY